MRPRFSLFNFVAQLLVGCGLFAEAVLSAAQPAENLDQNFVQPPITSRPQTLWMWMNGNVTSDGITRDLEAMRRVGLGGALIFNVGEYIPKGPVDYGRPPWLYLVHHAAREADRLGLELAMHNCPGWSSSGGPWITPAMAMQQLVWSETRVAGGARTNIALPQPFTRLGYYRDIYVLAFPSLPGEEGSFADLVSGITNGQGAVIDKKLLTDRDVSTSVPSAPDNPLVLRFAEPLEARAITVGYTSGGGTISFTLEASNDGINFSNVVRLTPASPRAIEDASLVESFPPVRAQYFRVTPSRARGVCEVELHRASRIPAWNYKANFSFRAARQEELPVEADRRSVIDPDQVVDLSGRVNSRGMLQWTVPPGSWTILRIGFTPRGQENIASPDSGVGLECDKMSRAAATFHFEHGLGKLMERLGSLAGKSFTALEVDSYEVGVQNWTAGFEKEFEKRNDYDLKRYLPAMTGRYVGSANVSERFLWDLRRTQAQLVAEYYYGQLSDLCRRHKLKLLVEPYGAGPGAYDELQIAGRADLPMGEFWAHFPWDDLISIKLAASAAHTHGRAIVAGESFTATEEQSRFLDYPYALKTTGDLAFSLGLNQMYFHRFAHQPHPSAIPGMTMGPWGFNFDRNNSWFEKSSLWLDYLARCQFLLRQGNYVADVLYFTGEGSPQMSKRIIPDLPSDLNFDAVDTEVLLKASVSNGRIVLPGGGSYQVLAMPADLKGMTPEVLRKLRDLVSKGARLVGPKPKFSPTLRGYPQSDAEVRRLADEMWGTETNRLSRVFGSGDVFAPEALKKVSPELGLNPDFAYGGRNKDADLVWLHRRLKDTDVYFVANRQRRSEEIWCSFRVSGKRPEFWNPETGEIRSAAVYSVNRDRVEVPMRFGPAESVFVVFREPASSTPVARVRRDEIPVIDTTSAYLTNGWQATSNIADNFTVAAWIKPDTDIYAMPRESITGRVDQNGKSYVVPVPDTNQWTTGSAAILQSNGHAAMGIAAARNGVCVIEGSTDGSPAVLVSRTPLSGWTHLAVVYRDGKPVLYLNGKLDREGLKSGKTVHPAVGVPAQSRRLVYHFDGDHSPVEVFPEAFSDEQVAGLAAKGLPAPEEPGPIEVYSGPDQKVAATIWQNGNYTLDNRKPIQVTQILEPIQVQGPWQLSIPDRSGAVSLTITNLESWHRSSKPEVRYFSGMATYRTSLELPPNAFAPNRHLWLDLGRVAVIAEVRVNGRELGTFWRPPYRVEITDAVRTGANELEVRITNLLVNRLIGDERLPVENEYDPRTRAIKRLPDWFAEGRPKPSGGRTTFSTWRFYTGDDPLVESGLLGPARVLSSVSAVFE